MITWGNATASMTGAAVVVYWGNSGIGPDEPPTAPVPAWRPVQPPGSPALAAVKAPDGAWEVPA